MANPGALLRGAKMLSKTPMAKKATKKVLNVLRGMKKESKLVPSKYKQGGRGPGATTRTTKPAKVSKSYGQQQASTNNLMRDPMTKKMELQGQKNVNMYKDAYKKIVK
jgi:hypothetical protein